MTEFSLTTHVVTEREWPELSRQFADRTYEQSLTYARAAAERIGAENEFVVVQSSDQSVIAAACLRIKRIPVLGRGIAWIVSGPMMDLQEQPLADKTMLQAVLIALRDHVAAAGHVLRLRLPAVSQIDHDMIAEAAAAEGFELTQMSPSYRTVIIDLSPDEDEIMKALHGKWRNPLRNAMKAGLQIDVGPISEMADRFDVMYRQVQQSKGFAPDIGPDFFYNLSGQDFDHDVLVAHKDGKDLGGFTVGLTYPNAVYLFGATTESGRRENAGHFLMWHAAMLCKSRGFSTFDLGGISIEDNPSVARFKLRTGGKERVSAGPFQVCPKTSAGKFILTAERLHRRLKGAA